MWMETEAEVWMMGQRICNAMGGAWLWPSLDKVMTNSSLGFSTKVEAVVPFDLWIPDSDGEDSRCQGMGAMVGGEESSVCGWESCVVW